VGKKKMMQGNKFLKWKTSQSNLASTLEDILSHHTFADVTLVSDDLTEIQAHKLVLSACSPILKNVFMSHKNNHPVLVMSGFKHQDLLSIIEFMYLGEVRVDQDKMDAFFDIAINLDFSEVYTAKQSIAEDDEKVNAEETNKSVNQEMDIQQQRPDDYKQEFPSKSLDLLHELINVSNIYICNQCEYRSATKRTLKKHHLFKHEGVVYFCDKCEFKAGESAHLNRHKQSKHDGVVYSCSQCEFQCKRKDSIKTHQQVKHEGVVFSCTQCEFDTTSQRGLKLHQQSVHEGIQYHCDQCEYKATTKKNLLNHQQSKHDYVRYSCDQCVYQATTQGSLKMHKEYKHEGVRYSCGQCVFLATTQGGLKSHNRSKH
jgi:hypothetical protein